MFLLGNLQLSVCRQALQAIFADGLQHGETWLPCLLPHLIKQTLLQQRVHPIQNRSCCSLCSLVIPPERATHFLCGLQGEATHKDGEVPEEALLMDIQQIITPRQSMAQGLLTRGQRRGSLCEQQQALREPR